MSPLLISSIVASSDPFNRGVSFSNSFLVEVRASCENTGWFVSRDASCVNLTKFAKEHSPYCKIVNEHTPCWIELI